MGILILNKQIACKVTKKYLYTQEFYKIMELYELTPRAKQPEFFYKKQHKQLARQSYGEADRSIHRRDKNSLAHFTKNTQVSTGIYIPKIKKAAMWQPSVV